MNETTHHEDGIYIDLDEDEYHADPALGSTDVRNLSISPAHYWANSHLNPNRKTESTPAQVRGSAYHALVCEGEAVFHERYCREFNKADYPDALDTVAQLRKFIKSQGGTIAKNAIKPDIIQHAMMVSPDVQIIDLLRERHNPSDKIAIKADDFDWIMYAYEALQACEASKLFTGGTPEISIFWTTDGIRCKSRIDYVTPDHALNLKTVTQMQKIIMDEFIPLHIARERLHIQAYWEMMALQNGQSLSIINGRSDGAFRPETYSFVFQETGDNPAPCVRTFRQFSPGTKITNGYWRLAEEDVLRALQVFKTFQSQPQTEGSPWIEDTPARGLADEEFPAYFIAR